MRLQPTLGVLSFCKIKIRIVKSGLYGFLGQMECEIRNQIFSKTNSVSIISRHSATVTSDSKTRYIILENNFIGYYEELKLSNAEIHFAYQDHLCLPRKRLQKSRDKTKIRLGLGNGTRKRRESQSMLGCLDYNLRLDFG